MFDATLKPITSVEQFKGMRVRAWGAYVPADWSSLGAAGVNAVTPEMYEALDKGPVNPAFFCLDSSRELKLYEVAKCALSHNFGSLVGGRLGCCRLAN